MGNKNEKENETENEVNKIIEEVLNDTKFTLEQLEKEKNLFIKNYPDGKMSKKEFVRDSIEQYGGDKKYFETIFDKIDINGDGVMDFKEYLFTKSISCKFFTIYIYIYF